MHSTKNNGYLLQQPGLIQNGELTTGLHDAILHQAVLMASTEDYRPIWPYWKRKRPISWVSSMIEKLNFRNRQVIRKQTKKHYRPASTISGN